MNTCKDVEAARKLIAQMQNQTGRHNSNRECDSQSPTYIVPKEGEQCIPGQTPETLSQHRARFTPNYEREIHTTVSLPNRIRNRLEDCEVGDCVKTDPIQHGNWVRLTIIMGDEHCERLFKRVETNGQSFWLRTT